MIDTFAVMNLIGLLAFAVVGSLKAIDADLDLFAVAVLGVLTALGGGVLVLATITGVGGGLVSDVLLGNVPFVLVEGFYATCAVVCATVVLSLRIVAIRRGWGLPTA